MNTNKNEWGQYMSDIFHLYFTIFMIFLSNDLKRVTKRNIVFPVDEEAEQGTPFIHSEFPNRIYENGFSKLGNTFNRHLSLSVFFHLKEFSLG